jgi:hypothetical protein
MVAEMRQGRGWPSLEALAPTLAYDSEVMRDIATGGAVPIDHSAGVTASTLVLEGGASTDWMIEVGRELAGEIRNGVHRVLEGQEHVVPPQAPRAVVSEVLAEP